MAGKQAKVFSRTDLNDLLEVAAQSRFPERDRVIVLLSAQAGLRACEIARLTWNMVADASGNISQSIDVRDNIAKRGSGRRIPMHPELREALHDLKLANLLSATTPDALVVPSLRGGAKKPNSIVNWFVARCKEAGLDGCSSHSGRRTFITRAARKAHHAGACLRDVQLLAGHSSIETTQGYIDGDSHAQRRLVRMI